MYDKMLNIRTVDMSTFASTNSNLVSTEIQKKKERTHELELLVHGQSPCTLSSSSPAQALLGCLQLERRWQPYSQAASPGGQAPFLN